MRGEGQGGARDPPNADYWHALIRLDVVSVAVEGVSLPIVVDKTGLRPEALTPPFSTLLPLQHQRGSSNPLGKGLQVAGDRLVGALQIVDPLTRGAERECNIR